MTQDEIEIDDLEETTDEQKPAETDSLNPPDLGITVEDANQAGESLAP
ncbi:MAG TPA: hypothetical protein VJC09_01590 [Candidatus Saccharimonadales bacterium]|nr:hypothetical protein [Candidatus Saccharimonadales bacterium]